MHKTPGAIERNSLIRCDDTVPSELREPLASKAEVSIYPGDIFVIETSGGGGFGALSS